MTLECFSCALAARSKQARNAKVLMRISSYKKKREIHIRLWKAMKNKNEHLGFIVLSFSNFLFFRVSFFLLFSFHFFSSFFSLFSPFLSLYSLFIDLNLNYFSCLFFLFSFFLFLFFRFPFRFLFFFFYNFFFFWGGGLSPSSPSQKIKIQ